MRRVVSDNWLAFNTEFEGMLLHAYLDARDTDRDGVIEDGEPLVTTLCGNMIEPLSLALDLGWEEPDGQPTSDAGIVEQLSRVKRATHLAKLGGNHPKMRALTTMRIPRAKGEAFVRQRLFEMAGQARRRFDAFDSWPAAAQLATLSMFWAMGDGGVAKFKRFAAAAAVSDFATMADECLMQPNAGSLRARNRAGKALLLLAARVVADGLDPDILASLESSPAVPDASTVAPSLANGLRAAIEVDVADHEPEPHE